MVGFSFSRKDALVAVAATLACITLSSQAFAIQSDGRIKSKSATGLCEAFSQQIDCTVGGESNQVGNFPSQAYSVGTSMDNYAPSYDSINPIGIDEAPLEVGETTVGFTVPSLVLPGGRSTCLGTQTFTTRLESGFGNQPNGVSASWNSSYDFPQGPFYDNGPGPSPDFMMAGVDMIVSCTASGQAPTQSFVAWTWAYPQQKTPQPVGLQSGTLVPGNFFTIDSQAYVTNAVNGPQGVYTVYMYTPSSQTVKIPTYVRNCNVYDQADCFGHGTQVSMQAIQGAYGTLAQPDFGQVAASVIVIDDESQAHEGMFADYIDEDPFGISDTIIANTKGLSGDNCDSIQFANDGNRTGYFNYQYVAQDYIISHSSEYCSGFSVGNGIVNISAPKHSRQVAKHQPIRSNIKVPVHEMTMDEAKAYFASLYPSGPRK